ncbi:nucleic acid-binding protein [Cylindrobasidium torrendii FP15055 ss-10]|uniref:Nucleic acid-binding protein n=1 Tax=Cylindrobasidium torrendii FP15055 ss-10 TaxID=1314674 RepID=A0A0D7BPM5_9AGAR|nr:nucleic acid-binding protein [Cylindrobasidium torrendii FP15055 ss-10]
MSTDYYSGGGGGGGFLSTQNSPGGSQSGSPGGRMRSDASSALRPMKIAQLLKCVHAPDNEWRLDDVIIGNVTVVALVLDISKSATNTSYSIEDGSGTFEVRHWSEGGEEDEAKWGGVEKLMYVRVTGQLKAFGNKTYMNTNMPLHPILDYHEIIFHDLECISAYLHSVNGPPPVDGTPFTTPNAATAGAVSGESKSKSMSTAKWGKRPPLQLNILQYLSNHDDENGQAVGDIAVNVGESLSDPAVASRVSAALDALMDDGLIFTTTDDSTFKLA